MVLTLKVLAVVVLLVVAAMVGLRLRKLRRDQARELARSQDRRLMTPPPSPYTPSKGFRLLDGHDQGTVRPAPTPPRLDPQRHYVFSDAMPSSGDDVVPSISRHDQEWLLHRSSNRSSMGALGAVVAVIAVVAFVVAAIFIATRHHATPGSSSTSTTTTSSPVTSTSHALGAPATIYVSFA
ncbi:MAG: hypothetical protein KGJ10_07090 [Acidobacteriota bacterium]|nr:hypothetical protein [Acidobacteriota bacterium]MDE3044575.1 hypothetical protein [Acidobacteriota bacterium]MDE3107226.1 hypothetical protein [Acidobacteriota bacterium]